MVFRLVAPRFFAEGWPYGPKLTANERRLSRLLTATHFDFTRLVFCFVTPLACYSANHFCDALQHVAYIFGLVGLIAAGRGRH